MASVALLRNTAFQDEALYLYAGRLIVHHWMGGPAPMDHYAFYFSGYPYVYPVIAGFLDRIGGLELARSFSLASMLGVTAIVYSVTRKLFQQPAALFAAAAYASTGVVLFLGRLATFDAMCLFLIALAAAIALHSGMSKRPWMALAVGPVLVLAILTKYAALLFVLPVLGLLMFGTVAFVGLRSALLRLGLALTAFALSLGVAYKIVGKAGFHAISGSTTNRVVGLQVPRLALFGHVLQMGGLLFFIALAGLLLLLRHRSRMWLPAVVLFGSSLLAPVYHIYMREPISLDKHIAYALFFAMPLVGYALAWLSGYERRPVASPYKGYWLGGLAAVTAVFILGVSQSRALYANWANTSQLSDTLRTQLRDGTGRVLAEDIEVARFDARRITEEWQWSSPRYPTYIYAPHRQLTGNPALAKAIKDRYYDIVELSFNYLPQDAFFVAEQMAAARNYDLIGKVPLVNSYGRGHFYVWRSALVAGHGNFTSLAQLHTKAWP